MRGIKRSGLQLLNEHIGAGFLSKRPMFHVQHFSEVRFFNAYLPIEAIGERALREKVCFEPT